MTPDIKKLVERLRVAEIGEAFQTEDGSPELQRTELGLDAADALEALAGDVEALRERNVKMRAFLAETSTDAENRLRAERDRLKAALEKIELLEQDHWSDDAASICRKALGGDAS